MPEKTKPQEFPTLLGTGHAAVFGLPKNFDLKAALANAKEVRLATAFALLSGWESIQEGIRRCKGTIHLLTGLELNHTDPQVLRDWLELQASCPAKVEARLATDKVFFHPKVLIVHGKKLSASFAIVGSGNLSDGGLASNVECGVVVRDSATLKSLTSWFEQHLQFGTRLIGKMISEYEPWFHAAQAKRDALGKAGQEATQRLTDIGTAAMTEWNEALNAAVEYFKSAQSEEDYAGAKQAAGKIRRSLHAPNFNFSREDFEEFYAARSLGGRLDERARDKLFPQRSQLRVSLRELLKRPELAIPEVLGQCGKLRVQYLGVATVSKILAAHIRLDWPVYNRMAGEVLSAFGYEPVRADAADKYLAFRNLMKRFLDECRKRGCKQVDFWALDRFMLNEWRSTH